MLSVRVDPPDYYKRAMDNPSWDILLEGEIDRDAPARVAEALRKVGRFGPDVYISSRGGNLLAGMEIGRLLRKSGATTHLARRVVDPKLEFAGNPFHTSARAECFSACALAFLGGNYRFADEDSEYGVHRFYSANGPTNRDLDVGQILSAAVATYIRDMDVNPELFDIMVQSSPDEIAIVDAREMKRLNVINNGRKPPEWSIEVSEGGQYFRGFQETQYGWSKVMLMCHRKYIYFFSIYEVGEKASAILSWEHSLMIDDDLSPLPPPASFQINGDVLSTQFSLTAEQVTALASAESIGHAMQVSREAPTFVGHKVDVPSADSEKIGQFIENCVLGP